VGRPVHCQASLTRTIGSRCSTLHPDSLPKSFSVLLAGALDDRPPSRPSPCVAVQCSNRGGRAPTLARAGPPPPRVSATGRAHSGGRAPSRPAQRMRRRPATSTENLCGNRPQAVLILSRAPHRGGANRRSGAPANPFRGHRDSRARQSAAAWDEGEAGGCVNSRSGRPVARWWRSTGRPVGWFLGGYSSARTQLTAAEATRTACTPTLLCPIVSLSHLSPSGAPPHPSRFCCQTHQQKKPRANGRPTLSDGGSACSSAGTRQSTGGLFRPSQRHPPDARGGSYAPAAGCNVRPPHRCRVPPHTPRPSLLPLRCGPARTRTRDARVGVRARATHVRVPTIHPWLLPPARSPRSCRCRAPIASMTPRPTHAAARHRVQLATVGHGEPLGSACAARLRA